MRIVDNEKKLYLLVDIDDLLVHSSDKLQEVLNSKTNFKTDVLQMLEQLKRNCRYYVNKVKEECEIALKEGRNPQLDAFPNFNNLYKLDTDPISFANSYLEMASKLLEQFLEERDTFLEIDNLPKGEIKYFNYEKELKEIIKYFDYVHKNKDAFHQINKYCLSEARGLVDDAKKKNQDGSLTIPEYGDLVSMNTNDIIKSNSISSIGDQKYKEYILYSKPLSDIINCIDLENHLYDVIVNASVFYTPSEEIVDYSEIHSLKNVNWDAVSLVEKLIHSGIFTGVYFSTHHNGYREEKAKRILMQQIIPEATGFIGQRFHNSEHNARRRDRSSKIDNAVDYLCVFPKQIVLFDDSAANCGDCKKKGGTEILYKPVTDAEIINNKITEMDYNRILKLDDTSVYGIVAQAYVKQGIEDNKTLKKTII